MPPSGRRERLSACRCRECKKNPAERAYLLAAYLDQWVRLQRPDRSDPLRVLLVGAGAAGAEVDLLRQVMQKSVQRKQGFSWHLTFLDKIYAAPTEQKDKTALQSYLYLLGQTDIPETTIENWPQELRTNIAKSLCILNPNGQIGFADRTDNPNRLRLVAELADDEVFDVVVTIGWDTVFAPRTKDPLFVVLRDHLVEEGGVVVAHIPHDELPYPYVLGTGSRRRLLATYCTLRAQSRRTWKSDREEAHRVAYQLSSEERPPARADNPPEGVARAQLSQRDEHIQHLLQQIATLRQNNSDEHERHTKEIRALEDKQSQEHAEKLSTLRPQLKDYWKQQSDEDIAYQTVESQNEELLRQSESLRRQSSQEHARIAEQMKYAEQVKALREELTRTRTELERRQHAPVAQTAAKATPVCVVRWEARDGMDLAEFARHAGVFASATGTQLPLT